MQVFVVGAAIRAPMRQIRIAAVVVGTGSQPRFEEHDRASQVSSSLSNGSSNLSMRSSGDLRPLKTMNAHCPVTTARLIRSGKLVDRLACTATSRQKVCMIFSTQTFKARQSSPATPQHTSRLVTTPTSLRGRAAHYSIVLGGCQVHRHRMRAVETG